MGGATKGRVALANQRQDSVPADDPCVWTEAGVDQPRLEALAAAAAGAARPGDAFLLDGDLGAGKTTFARAFIRARGALAGEPVAEVPSPTFTLVQQYELGGGAVWHFDLYRIENPSELTELGLDEALAGGIALIEWPARLGGQAPAATIEIALAFEANPEQRTLTVTDRSGDGHIAAALDSAPAGSGAGAGAEGGA
jgi:tRNA threonylcarbamoyl adenosine modification protein YjeE